MTWYIQGSALTLNYDFRYDHIRHLLNSSSFDGTRQKPKNSTALILYSGSKIEYYMCC